MATENTNNSRIIHGESSHSKKAGKGSPEYRTWSGIKTRCLRSQGDSRKWENYGGRGITICERWRCSYVSFLEDMGRRPSAKHSIERIDTNGNYCPENCRWATPKEQARNKRTTAWITLEGETKSASEWGEQYGIKAEILIDRRDRGWSTEDLLKPPRKKVRVEIDGQIKSVPELAKQYGIDCSLIYRRLKLGRKGTQLLDPPIKNGLSYAANDLIRNGALT